VNDPDLIHLREKVNANLVRELKFGARVTVRMKNGTKYKGFLATPKGNPANPLSFEEIAKKFRDTAKFAIPKKNIEALIEKIGSFEKLPDVKEMLSLMGSKSSVSPVSTG
jgi:2-methylcitrate dehydratase PrpD